MNQKLSKKEYETLREAIEQLWQIKEDLKSVRFMIGFKDEGGMEKSIQDVRGMIRQVAEGEIKE